MNWFGTTTHNQVEDRLGRLGSRLQSPATRDATRALGTLDRVLTNCRDTEDETDDRRWRSRWQRARDTFSALSGHSTTGG